MKLYQMYNGYNSNLLSDYPIIEAKNGAEACKKLLNKLNIQFTKIKRSASNYVRIKAEPFIEKNGYKYRIGRFYHGRVNMENTQADTYNLVYRIFDSYVRLW